jgi:chemotaxis family two-component system response regulator Rcp1
MNDTVSVLLAEDNPGDVYLVGEALRAHGLIVSLHVAFDGEQAISFIEAADRNESAPRIDIALLDLNLPKKSGLEVLARLRRSATSANVPVAVISSSPTAAESVASAGLHADYYFVKPSDYNRFMVLGEIVKKLLNK